MPLHGLSYTVAGLRPLHRSLCVHSSMHVCRLLLLLLRPSPHRMGLCPLHHLFTICSNIHSWLTLSPDNVVVRS